jgi:hypothetical protein
VQRSTRTAYGQAGRTDGHLGIRNPPPPFRKRSGFRPGRSVGRSPVQEMITPFAGDLEIAAGEPDSLETVLFEHTL